LQGFANPPYLCCFLFSGLLRVAPYCVPGGIRVVSKSLPFVAFEGSDSAEPKGVTASFSAVDLHRMMLMCGPIAKSVRLVLVSPT
jgi:hypothetical protein